MTGPDPDAMHPASAGLPKTLTGIGGLDAVTGGGLPKGRPTLLCGSAGCGKTLLAMEFLLHGAIDFDEPGAFIAFEETGEELSQNVRSLGFDVDALVAAGRLAVDHVRIDRAEVVETGDYDLEGLFLRLALAIDAVGARRVVLDTIETLFGGFTDSGLLRSELRRLFRWLKDRGLTTIITAERGDGALTRQGLEEYVSDCVILLDHRVIDQVSTRRLRIVKYRGTAHGTNEYPFLIDEQGISVLPITALRLDHEVSSERVPSGISGLDRMLGGEGYFRGSSILVSGPPGTGKTSIAAHFAHAVCTRGGSCLYLALEESPRQLSRNMRSIGFDLDSHIASGALRIHATRATMHGLETHLAQLHRLVAEARPSVVIIDPISNLISNGELWDAQLMLVRLFDFLKANQITALATSLTRGGSGECTDVGASSLIDTWLLLRDLEGKAERTRGLYVLKSRGMPHSRAMREVLITSRGVDLGEVFDWSTER